MASSKPLQRLENGVAGSANGKHRSQPSQAARRGVSKISQPFPPASSRGPYVGSVLIGFISGNEVSKSFMKSYHELTHFDRTNFGYLSNRADSDCGPLQIVDGRNQLAKATLDQPHCQWLFMVDTDMGFEPDTLAKLLAVADPVERPVVGGLCFSMREVGGDGMNGKDTYPTPTILNWMEHDDGIWRFTGTNHYPVNTMIRVGATGTACILIHRSVLERIKERDGEHWFSQTKLPDGMLEGEDISFCHRCKDLGINVWVHTGIRTTHYKHIWLSERDFWQSRFAPPATETVDVIIPALHRPQNVKTLMESLRATTGLARAWWVTELNDDEEHDAIRREGASNIIHTGTFAQKVNAAFDAIPNPSPWILLVGDDVRFRPGWLDHALNVADRWKADVVGTNDLLNPRVMRGEHATHMLIRRSYIDETGASWDGPGIVCHEGYRHWYVDDEIVQAAKMRGKFQSAMGSHVEHVHPLNGITPMDEIYELGQSFQEVDKARYKRRLQDAQRGKLAPTVRILEAV